MYTFIIRFVVTSVSVLKKVNPMYVIGILAVVYFTASHMYRGYTVAKLQSAMEVSDQAIKDLTRTVKVMEKERDLTIALRHDLSVKVRDMEIMSERIQQDLNVDISNIRKDVTQSVDAWVSKLSDTDKETLDVQKIIDETIVHHAGQRVLDSMWDAHCNTIPDPSSCARP